MLLVRWANLGVIFLITIFSTGRADAACDATPMDDKPGYEKASDVVAQLPEFKAWAAYVDSRAGVRILFGGSRDKQITIQGICYWSVTVYSDEGTHLHRWNTFFTPVASGTILVEDANGDAVPRPSSLTPAASS